MKPKDGTPKIESVQRFGSGRLLPTFGETGYRPFREKTGREFAQDLIK